MQEHNISVAHAQSGTRQGCSGAFLLATRDRQTEITCRCIRPGFLMFRQVELHIRGHGCSAELQTNDSLTYPSIIEQPQASPHRSMCRQYSAEQQE